jgi:tetratricopeptide (TPR) repeat protein
MSIRFLLATSLSLSILAFAPAHAADNAAPAVAAVPTPDLSKLPADRAAELRSQRDSFEKSKSVLIGDPLAETYALLGAAYARNGFYDAADVALADAVAIAPKNGRWLYMRGVLAATRNQNDAARKDFEQAFTLDQSYLPIRMAVASSRMASNDLDGARKLLEPFAARKQVVPIAVLGDIAMKQKRYPDAVTLFKRAAALAPEATRLNAQLADAYTAVGDTKSAAEARAKAGNVAPSLYDPVGQRVLGGNASAATAKTTASPKDQAIDEALAQIETRQYDAARKSLDAALQKSPNDSMLLTLYGRLEAMTGHLPAARTRLDAALRADPKNGMALVWQGFADEIGNDDAAAEKAYKHAIDVVPAFDNTRIALATLYLRNKRYDEAIAQYQALLKINPKDGEAWTRLVAANAIAGRCADSLKLLNDALRGAPNEGFLLQLFVRTASTCPAASAQEKRMALDYGLKLYRATNVPPISEAYALALAANGKWDDAVKTQEGVMFMALRNGGKETLAPYKEFLELFRAHKVPPLPWSSQAALFNPQRPQADTAPSATAPPK